MDQVLPKGCSIDFHNRRYRARIRLKDQPVRSKLFETQAEAAAWLLDQMRQVEAQTTTTGMSQTVTLGERVKVYGTVRTPKKKQPRKEMSYINYWMNHEWAGWPIAKLQIHHVQQWVDDMERAGFAPSTINNRLSKLSEVYKDTARVAGFGGLQNPCVGVRKPASRRAREAHLDPSLDAEVMALCEDPTRPWLPVIVRLAMLTGMRRGELVGMTWENVHPTYVHLPETKNGDKRDVPLSSEARKVLGDWRLTVGRDRGRVFDGVTDEQVSYAYTKVMEALEEKHGIKNLRFHDLRHVALTRLSTKLANVLELSAVSGHKSLQTLKRYYNPKAADLAAKLG